MSITDIRAIMHLKYIRDKVTNKYPIKYPKIPPRTENIDAIKNIFKYSFFLAITIGIIIASGGIGKKELSIKDTSPK